MILKEKEERLAIVEEELSLAQRDAQQALELKEALEASLQETGRASATLELDMASLREDVQALTNDKEALETELLEHMDEKEKILSRAVKEKWILCFEHDPVVAAASVREEKGRVVVDQIIDL